ncbi:MAG: carbon-nitrogen hydrolase family protein [Actinobacteria bacterium]|nr:MAG: carbon-nitrogen hydrolase family protein [Actinomycetota bacterium]
MNEPVKVACVQAEPVVLQREATIEKIAALAREAAGVGARLALFPEAFVPVYPTNRWVRFLAGGADVKPVFGRLARESIEVPSAATERLAGIAREEGIWLAVGANELAGGTLYNSLLVFGPDSGLVVHHRKLMPTNHERLVWGLGDGQGLEAVQTDLGRVGGLICWENLMPLARFALYQSGVEVYLAPTADDSESWHESIRHIARESRAFVLSCCVFQRASSYPDDVPLAEGPELLGRGGSAILAPDGSYLAGPLWDEEGILYAELDPQRLYEERQRFDPAGHYHRPDVFRLVISRVSEPRRGAGRARRRRGA